MAQPIARNTDALLLSVIGLADAFEAAGRGYEAVVLLALASAIAGGPETVEILARKADAFCRAVIDVTAELDAPGPVPAGADLAYGPAGEE